MRVESSTEPREGWDAFVQRTPGAQLGHAAAWPGILQRVYGLEPVCLVALDDAEEIAGVMALAVFRGLKGRRELISLPYLDASGPLASGPEARRALLDAGLEQARHRGVGAFEVRELETAVDPSRSEAVPANAVEPAHRVDLQLDLEPDEEAQWKAVGAKVRNQTRKATKQGLVLGEATGLDAMDAFYEPFCENMRDLGSPVHARRFFVEIMQAFGGSARLVTCRGEAGSVGGLLAIDFAGTVSVPWASTLRSERKRCPNNLIYWEALRWAISRGAGGFDFGRSPIDAGTYKFKKGWGARERPLRWDRWSASGETLTVAGLGDDPVMQRLSALWARMPVGFTRLLGPVIRRRISA